MNSRFSLILICLCYLLTACSGQKTYVSDGAPAVHPANIEQTPDAVPTHKPKSRGGNPSSYEVFGKTYYVLDTGEGFSQRGMASWYGTKFHGNKTSNGETYNMYAMTAAHKTLPIPSYVEVINFSNNKKIIVMVNDRGPFQSGRIIDLSYAAAAKLGILKKGTSSVTIRVINPATFNSSAKVIERPLKAVQTATTTRLETSLLNKNRLFIQVGAFESFDNAKKLKDQLNVANFTHVIINSKNSHSDSLHRVQMGPYLDADQAYLIRLKLRQTGFIDAHFMPRSW